MLELGAFPALSLADARGLRADYLALLANGIDPQVQAEVTEEEQQIALDSIFRRLPLTGYNSKAKALLLITQKTFGAHWRKMYSLPLMIYAVNTGLIDANPASGVGMAFEKPKKQNMPTLRPEELPKLMRSLA